jgi:hypothetical protein
MSTSQADMTFILSYQESDHVFPNVVSRVLTRPLSIYHVTLTSLIYFFPLIPQTFFHFCPINTTWTNDRRGDMVFPGVPTAGGHLEHHFSHAVLTGHRSCTLKATLRLLGKLNRKFRVSRLAQLVERVTSILGFLAVVSAAT